MDGPQAFIGVPDWRSAVLAAAFAVPWLWWIGRGWLKCRSLWLAVAIAAVLFPFSIAWIQVPLQSGLNALWSSLLDPATIRQYLLLLAIPSLLVASVVQEGVKVVVAILALRLAGESRNPKAGLAFGAAAGAGYGGFEAFWVFNQIFAIGWSIAMVQLQGPQALLGFIERFFAVPFHIGSAAIAGYGYATGRFWRFWLLAVGLHTISNFSVVALQAGLIDLVVLELWVAFVALVTGGVAIWLRRRCAETRVREGE